MPAKKKPIKPIKVTRKPQSKAHKPDCDCVRCTQLKAKKSK